MARYLHLVLNLFSGAIVDYDDDDDDDDDDDVFCPESNYADIYCFGNQSACDDAVMTDDFLNMDLDCSGSTLCAVQQGFSRWDVADIDVDVDGLF